MIKNLIISFVFIFSVSTESQEAINQWVFNALERAQLNVDNGNLEAAEKIYYDYASVLIQANHMIILYY